MQLSRLPGAGRRSLYQTSNQSYGTTWMIDKDRVKQPTFAEVVGAMQDFSRAEKQIKNKLVAERFGEIEKREKAISMMKKTAPKLDQLRQVPHGLNVGPPIYRTSNMSYGSAKPTGEEAPSSYFPCNNRFTGQFCGGNFKNNGLNTARTRSNVHRELDS